MSFNVGDVVKVTSNRSQSSMRLHGQKCKIKKVHDKHVVLQEEGENPGGVWFDELELVDAAPAQVPTIVTTGGVKHDDNKIPCELLSPQAALGTAAVLKFGAKKYAPNNWRKGLAWTRVLGAIFRHLYAFMLGEDLDPETGLPHIDHAACEIMFLQEFYRTRKDLDDRYKPESKKE